MTVRIHDRLTRCTYRNTYRSGSPNCERNLQFVTPSVPVRVNTLGFPDSMAEVVTHEAVKCFLSEGASFGALAPTIPKGVAFTVSTTNFQAAGLTKLLYTVSETAQLLSLSRSTVYAFMKSGELLAVYPTSKARIPASAIVQFVQRSEVQARSEREAQRQRIR